MSASQKYIGIVDFAHFPYPYVPPPDKAMGTRGQQVVVASQHKGVFAREILRVLDAAYYTCTQKPMLPLIDQKLVAPRDQMTPNMLMKSCVDLSDLRHTPTEQPLVIRRRRIDDFPGFLEALFRSLNMCPRLVVARLADPGPGIVELCAVCNKSLPHSSLELPEPALQLFPPPSIFRDLPELTVRYQFASPHSEQPSSAVIVRGLAEPAAESA